MSGRALREDSFELAAAVLHQCIGPEALVLRAIMDISARAFCLVQSPPADEPPLRREGQRDDRAPNVAILVAQRRSTVPHKNRSPDRKTHEITPTAIVVPVQACQAEPKGS